MLVGPTQRGKTTLLDGWMGGWLGNLKTIYPTQKAELAKMVDCMSYILEQRSYKYSVLYMI